MEIKMMENEEEMNHVKNPLRNEDINTANNTNTTTSPKETMEEHDAIKKKKSKDVFSFEIIRDTFKKGKDKSPAIKQWGHWYRQVRTDMFTPRAFISRPTNDTFPSQNMIKNPDPL